ncbi:glycoside hydrolase family 97 protein [Sinomicrobium soli]|uniref:glycoside hydrolase family 97 protein n=1 Tax=Sinomicrobium sp. N-1-3-6 TaxID=2219864 RepID=UPI000DCD6582|nr:glycoside hydrolase family 97 protein [Sinomicrobium sp. N-1-3-6]RAV28021.1 glycoside hydrolase [Sinomicrobium sp. N-1-3-6]
MRHIFVDIRSIIVMSGLFFLFISCEEKSAVQELSLKDGLNTIALSLDENGTLYYEVKRNGESLIKKSPLGLVCNQGDFTRGLAVDEVSPVQERRENYRLKVGNSMQIDRALKSKSVSFKNDSGALMTVDLIAGEEGVAFRYRFPEAPADIRIVEEEITGFHIGEGAEAWLQPYNKAGDYTPAYEDFYLNMDSGDAMSDPRNPSVGWCMPALFNVNNQRNWVLIAESGTDGSYVGCHLSPDSEGGIYKIAFAKKDEKYTLPIDEEADAAPRSDLPWTMPWRVVIIGDKAGDILLSTLITDLAPASKIEDTSWIGSGKASWSWWSHPDDHSPEIYDGFTDLAVDFDWEYTLFDAGWEEANKEGDIIKKALSKGIKPMVWGYSANYFNPEERKKRFKELAAMGIKGVKIDFWCSDRQETMNALQGVFEDAANEHLMVNLHGATVPRGWHRTWPNFMTAEAILGTESYFYEQRFPERAAEQNTVLPFTRNVAGPADYTPVALTMRKFPRLTTAAHELATSMIYTSGIIHFADSREIFGSFPEEVKNLLKEMPATWDKTECIVGEPGKGIVLSRQKDSLSYIIGINGTAEEHSVKIDLSKYSGEFSAFRLIAEGEDPLMEFDSNTYPVDTEWTYTMAPRGGFIIQFVNDTN